MDDPERPYPPGIGFDEAWVQRQRADKLEQQVEDFEGVANVLLWILGAFCPEAGSGFSMRRGIIDSVGEKSNVTLFRDTENNQVVINRIVK